MGYTPEQLERLGRFVEKRRLQLRASQEQIAGVAQMSPVTWARVEKGLPVRRLTYAAVEDTLGWVEGSIDRVLMRDEEPITNTEIHNHWETISRAVSSPPQQAPETEIVGLGLDDEARRLGLPEDKVEEVLRYIRFISRDDQ